MTARPLSTSADHLRLKLPLAAGVAMLGVVARLVSPGPPARTAEAVAGMLGDAVAGAVSSDGFIWEERGGFVHDALLGRRVLFLAARGTPDDRGAADLYRAHVRVTRSGRPIGVRDVRNLTATPAGDDRDLVARGRLVAFTTYAFGAVQGITLLDLGGDAEPRATSFGERLRAAWGGWLETGAARGAVRTEVSFEKPPAAAHLDLGEGSLVMALGPDALPAALDARSGELTTGAKDPFGARVARVPQRSRAPLELAALSADRLLGRGAAAAVERVALRARRIATLWRGGPELVPPRLEAAPPAEQTPAGVASLWPPPPVVSAMDPPLAGEGAWVMVADPFGRALPSGGGGELQGQAGSPFAATFIRPDPERPRARVHLLAIDTRRIGLHLQAGFDAPRPTIGPRGTGKLPERLSPRILGAMGLGAGSSVEPLGTIVDGRALSLPRAGAATFVSDASGRPYFGPWPSGDGIPASLRSLWQSPWGFERGTDVGPTPAGAGAAPLAPALVALGSSHGDDVVAERAALCMTTRGFAVHAWGSAVSPATLVAALARAGCAAGLSLGRAPAPLGFAFLSLREDAAWSAARLLPAMSIEPELLTAASPDAFIYLSSLGSDPELAVQRGAAWAEDGGAQPHPPWIPAVHATDVVHLGAQVRIHAFAPDRFVFRLRAGSREVSPRNEPKLATDLPPDEQARVLAVISVGTGRRRGPRGLAVAGTIGLRFRGDGGLLTVRDGRVEIRSADRIDLSAETDATELPLTADGSKLRPEAREIGSMRRRSAACVLSDETFLVATTTFDSDEATTEALLDLGCARVVALDRGRHRGAFVHRAGRDPELTQAYEDTALFAVGTPMPGRARRLTPGAIP